MEPKPLKTKSNSKDSFLPEDLMHQVLIEGTRLKSSNEWKSFLSSWNSLYRATTRGALPVGNPRFNAIHWASDVQDLLWQIGYSLIWMKAYANFYKINVPPGSRPANVDPLTSYYADNALTRVDSCKDKVALMVWSFYIPFNPKRQKEVLIYEDIMERLRWPVKFGLNLKKRESFLRLLEILEDEDFNGVKRYRDQKIHRREPRIEIHGVSPHHDWPYVIPLTDAKEIKEFMESMKREYSDPTLLKSTLERCKKNGVYFDSRKLDRLWDYENVEKMIQSCLEKLLKVAKGCFTVLRRNSPFRA